VLGSQSGHTDGGRGQSFAQCRLAASRRSGHSDAGPVHGPDHRTQAQERDALSHRGS
jgi:hypothetical protein